MLYLMNLTLVLLMLGQCLCAFARSRYKYLIVRVERGSDGSDERTLYSLYERLISSKGQPVTDISPATINAPLLAQDNTNTATEDESRNGLSTSDSRNGLSSSDSKYGLSSGDSRTEVSSSSDSRDFNIHSDRSSSHRTKRSVQKTVCTKIRLTNKDRRRHPRKLKLVKCAASAPKCCRTVYSETKVLRRSKAKDGEVVWRVSSETIPTDCVCEQEKQPCRS